MNNVRQAIITKTIGPTEHKGLRIRVKAYAKAKIMPWDYSKDPLENHIAAANTFAESLDWLGVNDSIATGSMPDNDMHCHIIIERKNNEL